MPELDAYVTSSLPQPQRRAYFEAERRRLAAWRAHYLAKGCNTTKADVMVGRKRKTRTWPPRPQPSA